MQLEPDAEQDELRRTVRRFLEQRAPLADTRRRAESGDPPSRDLWRALAELGLLGLVVPEQFGGAGAGAFELALVTAETGRVLLDSPYLATAALSAAALVGCDRGGELLRSLATGDAVCTVAHPAVTGRGQVAGERAGPGWRLSGAVPQVLAGADADQLLVAADTGDGRGLFRLDPAGPGVTVRPLATLDPTRRQAALQLQDAVAEPVAAPGGDTAAALDRAVLLATVAMAAEQLGGAERCLQMSVSYAKFRRQFGRPIGSFQAVKHRCADMLVDVECARGLLYQAASVAAATGAGADPPADADDLPTAASLAKAACSDAFSRAAAANIQVHGGVGFTWEHDAHLYYRRACTDATLFGTADEHRARLASALGMTA